MPYKRKEVVVKKLKGRPSKYQDIYCADIIKHFENGGNIYSFCVEKSVDRTTVYEWIEAHKDFSHAYNRAQDLGKAYFMRKLQDNLANKEIQPVIMQMWGRYAYSIANDAAVRLPKLLTVKHPEQKMAVLQEAVAQGSITPDQAQKITTLIKVQSDLEVVGQLRADVEALKAQLGSK
jgi:Bacteriophage Sf6, terminase small subunit-like